MVSTPKRALILARISDARDGDTHGVDGQVGDCTAHARRLGWQCGPAGTHVVVENDTSAFTRRKIKLPDGRYELRTVRPGFRRALAMLASGEADGLIALDLDRACRDPRDLEDLIDVTESASPRIPVESVTGSLRLATDADVAMARVMVSMANKSSRDTARRVAAARQRKALEHGYGGGVRPFGFEPDGVTIRPSEAAEIVRAADAILGGVALRQVLLDLRTRGVATVKSAPWSSSAVRGMLRRPRNAGLAVYRGEIVGKAPWPAILPEDTWRAVVAILDDPARRQTPGNTPRWLGSLIYRCGVCDDGTTCRVHAVRSTGGQYRCDEKHHLARSAPRIDAYVTEVLISRLARDDAAEVLEAPGAPVDARALRREAASLRELLDEQARLHARGVIDSRQLEAGSGELRARIAAVEGQLAAAAGRDPLDGIAGRADAADVWAGLDLGRRRAILEALCVVSLYPGHPGRLPDGRYFDTSSIRVEWKR